MEKRRGEERREEERREEERKGDESGKNEMLHMHMHMLKRSCRVEKVEYGRQ